MGFLDKAKDEAKHLKDELGDKIHDVENKAHEKFGEMKGRHDQAQKDKELDDDDDEYEPEEKQV